MFTAVPLLNTPRSTFRLRSLLHSLPPISHTSTPSLILLPSRLYQPTRTMFANAINEYEQKPKRVAKSTSPNATRNAQQTKISPSGLLNPRTRPPSSSSTHPSVDSNVRDRSHKPQSNLASLYNAKDSFQENIAPPTEISNGLTNQDYGVYYNIDDFDDDFDIDCDSPAPVKADSYTIDLTSDAPLEWPASSPPHAPKREEEELTPIVTSAPAVKPKPRPTQEKPVTKTVKRTLPVTWPDATPKDTQSVEVKAGTKRSAAASGWDSLAADKMSDAKAAVRKLNMSKKDPETGPDFMKIKHKLAPVFLSEEQNTVVKLVTHGKKSVFFTGAAGMLSSVALWVRGLC